MDFVTRTGHRAPLRVLLRFALWLAFGMVLHTAVSMLMFIAAFAVRSGPVPSAVGTLYNVLSFPRPRPWDSVFWGAVFALVILALRRPRDAT